MAFSATLNHLSPPNLSPSASSRLDPLRTGAVKLIPPSEALVSLRSEGYRLLDIRPVWEWEKARVVGSLHVPLFVEDTDMSPLTLLKKWVHFGYIGLWTGQLFTTVNEKFVDEVKMAVPDEKDRILVACGEGLRPGIASCRNNTAQQAELDPGRVRSGRVFFFCSGRFFIFQLFF